jgi:hypothetical protein
MIVLFPYFSCIGSDVMYCGIVRSVLNAGGFVGNWRGGVSDGWWFCCDGLLVGGVVGGGVEVLVLWGLVLWLCQLFFVCILS